MKIISTVSIILISAVLLCACSGRGMGEHTRAGMEACEKQDYETALESFKSAEEAGEEPKLVYRGMGIANIGLTNYEEAAENLKEALQTCNGYVTDIEYDINYYLALAYYKLGDLDNALKTYDAIIAMKEKEADAHFLRGTLRLEQGDFEAARTDYERVMKLRPTDYSTLVDICINLDRAGYRQAGNEYLSEVLGGEENRLSDFDRGRLCYYLGDYEQARNCLEKSRDTNGAENAMLLGQTYEALGDYNYAISVYMNYLEQDSSRPELYNKLAVCRMNMGDYEEALADINTGLSLESGVCRQELMFNEIVCYEHLGQFRKAAVLMEDYLKRYPDDGRAVREHTFLKTR